MLQHKKTLGISLYKFGKSLRFSDAKCFHLTRCVLLPRVGSAKNIQPESNSLTDTVTSDINGKPNSNTNNNFYGIESDEGVIDIEKRSRNIKLEQELFINRLNGRRYRETFKKARFGTVRLDIENKPSTHGHFENTAQPNSDFEMNPIVENLQMIESVADPVYSSNMSVNNIPHDTLPSMNSHVINNEAQIQNDNKLNEIHFIDDFYFSKEMLDDKTKESPVSTDSEISDNPDPQKTCSTAEKNSFLDELYFSNKIADTINNCNSVEDVSKASSHEIMKIASLKSNSCTDKSLFLNKTLQSTNSDDSELKLSKANVKENGFSFIDESYFNLNENLDSQKSARDMTGIHESNTNIKEKGFSFIDENYFDNLNENLNSQKDAKDRTEIHESSVKESFDGKTNYNSNQNYNFDSYSSANYKNKISLNTNANYRSNDSLSDRQNRIEGNMNDLLKTNLSESMQMDSKIVEKKKENALNKNDSSVQEAKRKGVSGDGIETAHDFISKLRAEKKQFRPVIKGGKILPSEEKKDSKGFRILSNQVPNLQYFTRDEILTVLKNSILYSDDDIVVLNKPYNLVIHESKTSKDPCLSQYLDELASQLDNKNANPKLITVHRIDKETCGCLLLARNEISAQRLLSLFAQRKIIKTYWIVTIAVPDPLEGVIDIPIAEGSVDKKSRMVLHPKLPPDTPYENRSKHGKRAVTRYKVISTSGNAALIEAQPETGIKHQIRVHFGFGLSCPILGDHKYSHLQKMAPQKLPSDLLQRLEVRQSKVRHIPMHIYARSVTIPQYRDGQNLFVMAPMPTHISLNLQRLKFRKK